jgi:type VI secretion system protein ImpL
MSLLRRCWNGWRLRSVRRAEAQEERRQLRQCLGSAVQRLRHLGLASGLRRQDGGDLPWYALVGDAQSGKSAAMRALGFELLAAPGEERPASAPLAGWSSGKAVCWELSAELLESTPGRPHVDDVARELTLFRARLPLDGVLVTLPADQLLALSEGERETAALRLRRCLELLQQRLERELPVYLLVTKLDALPDFAAFWANIDAEECQAAWGASWQDCEREGGSFGAQVAAEWSLLGHVLHARVLDVISRLGGRDP